MKAIMKDNESSDEMKKSASKVAHRMIDSQRNIWGIRGMQMQSFMRMEAVQSKCFVCYKLPRVNLQPAEHLLFC